MDGRQLQNSIEIRQWLLLAGILFAALFLRLTFFTGFFGSDEVTYTGQALLISEGVWQPSSYIGGVRLGINLPVGLFFWIFGKSEFVANLWSLTCSLGEILLVFLIARRFWGTQTAIFAALLLAFTPLHAHFATRLMADAPLGFFITLSFYALFRGDAEESWRWYAVAGLSAGFVWWIKSSVALLYIGVFAIYLVREKRIATKWFIMATGFLVMFSLNCLVFLIMQGDPWHLVRFYFGMSERIEGWEPGERRTEAGYYLRYLLLDIRHTWLLGPLALLGLYQWLREKRSDDGLTKVAIWGLGLFSIFSFFIISLSQWTLVPKQVNYMLIFLAPLALLGGYGISKMPAIARMLIIALVVLTGIVGTALEQLDIRSFVANSPPTLQFASSVNGRPVYGMTNAYRYSQYESIFSPIQKDIPKIRDIEEFANDSELLANETPDDNGFVAYYVFDHQTSGWGNSATVASIDSIPQCWKHVDTIKTAPLGAGTHVAEFLLQATSLVPYGAAVASQLENLLTPEPAWIFGIAPQCLTAERAPG